MDALHPPKYTITCQSCGATIPAEPWRWRHECGGTLQVSVATDHERVLACRSTHDERMRRFWPVLPLTNAPDTAIGDTPVIHEQIDGVDVYFKLEYLNPGGSFKDRGAYVTVARCLEMGFESITVDSSGNAGVATARMGQRLGLGVDVFLPQSTPEGKKHLLRLFGAQLHEVAGDRMAVHDAALAATASGGAYVGHWFNPYFFEGTKTMAYEAYEQVPRIDYAFCPVGAGTVILGLHKGFSELFGAGLMHSTPRLVAAQAAGYSPVCSEMGFARNGVQPSVLADGIAIADPPRCDEIATVVGSTGGFCAIVDDHQIAEALSWLVSRGYVVEPTSAVPLAALRQAIADGAIPRGSSVLLPLSGTGMKVLDELAHIAGV